MIVMLVCSFFGLLILGFPIAMVVLISATLGVVVFSGTNPVILIQQLFNGLDNFILLAVPFFVIAGSLAANGETAQRLVDVMQVIVGRIRGGLVIATVLACAFFSAISGSSLATIVAVGTIMIPALQAAGYSKPMGTGVVTASGSLGVLIPPSGPMILFCVVLGTSVGRQFLAGFLPGMLIAVAFSVYVYIRCRQLNVGESKSFTLSESLKQVKHSILAIMFPVIVLGGIYGGITTPTEAAAVSVIYVLIIELTVYKKLKLKDLTKVLADSIILAGTLAFLVACAMAFSWFLTTQQIPAMLTEFIGNFIKAKWLFIAALLVFLVIAGCFLDIISLLVILAPLLRPTLLSFNISLIHFGIIAIVIAQVGFLTPPFGVNLVVSMGLTEQSLGEVAKATLPYLLILIGLAIVIAFVPDISLFLPNLFYGK